MRSSKSRSRGNKNRNNRPTGGNVINRVFDSSGPDGKVRGTPQQIIEKYTQLHRDAQLSGDRVNAENFAQHAEHYTRMLAEAQREVDRARDEQEQFNRDRQAERDRERSHRQNRPDGEGQPYAADPGSTDQPEVSRFDDPLGGTDVPTQSGSELVDLPEGKPAFLDARGRNERQGNRNRGPRGENRPRNDQSGNDGQGSDRQGGEGQPRGDRPRRDAQRSDAPRNDTADPAMHRDEARPMAATGPGSVTARAASPASDSAPTAVESAAGEPAAEKPAPRAPRPRKPRAPRAVDGDAAGNAPGTPAPEAAE